MGTKLHPDGRIALMTTRIVLLLYLVLLLLSCKQEPDETGPSGVVWLKPYTMVRVDEENALHVKSKALYVSWHDERFLEMPARFRGTHYCHLIAPSYLRRLLDGEVAVAGPDM